MRGLAQCLAREFQPRGVHVAHVIIDGVVAAPRFVSITTIFYVKKKINNQFNIIDKQCIIFFNLIIGRLFSSTRDFM